MTLKQEIIEVVGDMTNNIYQLISRLLVLPVSWIGV